MPNLDNEVEEIVYLKTRPDGGFDIVSKEDADVVKITLKSGEVIWAFPKQV